MTRLLGRLAMVVVAAATIRAEASTVYWNMQTASPTSNGLVATIGDITQGNNNGTTQVLSSTSASSGYSFDLNGGTTSASGSNNAGAAARVGTLETGTSGSAYFEFTLTPTSGNLSVNSFGFGSRSTSTGPQSWSLRSDADSFGADLATGALLNNSSWGYRTVTLGNSLDVPNGVTRTFRLFGYGGTGSASANTANWRIDDLQMSAVPEPSTLALGGLGIVAGCSLAARRLRGRVSAKN